MTVCCSAGGLFGDRLSDLVYIAGTDGYDKIAGGGKLAETGFHLLESGVEFRAWYACGEILGGYAEDVFLAGGIYLGQKDEIRT